MYDKIMLSLMFGVLALPFVYVLYVLAQVLYSGQTVWIGDR